MGGGGEGGGLTMSESWIPVGRSSTVWAFLEGMHIALRGARSTCEEHTVFSPPFVAQSHRSELPARSVCVCCAQARVPVASSQNSKAIHASIYQEQALLPSRHSSRCTVWPHIPNTLRGVNLYKTLRGMVGGGAPVPALCRLSCPCPKTCCALPPPPPSALPAAS